MRFAGRGDMLAEGLRGGHGPIRYDLETYDPGRRVVFRFRAPRGFDGTHSLQILELSETGGKGGAGRARCLLRHEIVMRVWGPARVTWPLVIRPLHDALLEDALDKAERAYPCDSEPKRSARWSFRVRVLRALFTLVRRRSASNVQT
jgi:hypothetical protein